MTITKNNEDVESFTQNLTESKGKIIIANTPKVCSECNSNLINFWGETDEEYVYQCQNCKAYHPIPFNKNNIVFYFKF